MEPVRILQVVTIMNRGGLETMLMNYYRSLDRSRIQFDFMTHRPEAGHYDDEIGKLGGRIYRMPPIRPGSYRRYFALLDDFFREHREYSVVHSHINENSSFVLRAARRAGIQCRIAHSHLSDLGLDFKLPFRLYARLHLKENANRFFACSQNAGRWLFGDKLSEQGHIEVLHNAVNAAELRFDPVVRAGVRKDLGVEDRLVIGHIGRFNPQKNHRFVLEVFQALHRQNGNTILLLVGDGALRRQMEKLAAALGLSGAVRFLGVRQDISSLLQAMDLFLFPSLFEGLPVALLEAQAAGLHCLVSDTITREADIAGYVEFESLKASPEVWAERILALPRTHEDTTEKIRANGYDAASMAEWLTGYYTKFCKPGQQAWG